MVSVCWNWKAGRRWRARALLFGSVAGLSADCLLQIVALLAPVRAQTYQNRELLPGLGELAGLNEEFAQILVCSLVVGFELQRLCVVRQRRRIIAGFPKRESEQVVDICL